MQRILGWGILGILSTGVLFALGVMLVFRGPALPMALACPGCGSLERVEPTLLIERGAVDAERRQIIDDVSAARRRVLVSFGGLHARAVIIACHSEACFRRFVGLGFADSRGLAFPANVLVLSPRRLGPTIAAHELSHIELHDRLGLRVLASGTLPAWIDEGLAVLVADDRRYLNAPGGSDRCLKPSDRRLPFLRPEWARAAAADHSLYADAACQVSVRYRLTDAQPDLRPVIADIAGRETDHAASFTTPESIHRRAAF